MRTIRISRWGFPNKSMYSWMNFFKFVLSKKYNVIIDPVNPDIVFRSNISYSMDQEDTYIGSKPVQYDLNSDKIKFIYVSGEVADFQSCLRMDNHWSIGYSDFKHEKYLRQPSGIFDVWTLFDECRLTDAPFNWLTEKRDFEKIKARNNRFCSITQASHNDFRKKVFDKLGEYKTVTSSGPWEQNIDPSEALNKYQWNNASLYLGRMDGLTYREKIGFFEKYKFNMAIHFTNTPFILQEKIFHAFFSGAIPIFYGNPYILYEGFNPNSFINLHTYETQYGDKMFEYFLEDIKTLDTDDIAYRNMIEQPIFANNKLPQYMDFDYTLSFLEKIIEG